MRTKTVFQLPMGYHQGRCKVCGMVLPIGGGPDVGGYTVAAHISSVRGGYRNEYCKGGDQPPAELILAKETFSVPNT